MLQALIVRLDVRFATVRTALLLASDHMVVVSEGRT